MTVTGGWGKKSGRDGDVTIAMIVVVVVVAIMTVVHMAVVMLRDVGDGEDGDDDDDCFASGSVVQRGREAVASDDDTDDEPLANRQDHERSR